MSPGALRIGRHAYYMERNGRQLFCLLPPRLPKVLIIAH